MVAPSLFDKSGWGKIRVQVGGEMDDLWNRGWYIAVEEGARLVSQNSKRAIALAVEGSGPYAGDRIFRRQLKYEAAVKPDYTLVDGDEVNSLSG
ncbi:MAG: hypothetical protein QGF23_00325, partial [Dehalococcoidales bacterium]|nr:hypothetical protein [Dehalococcoidales bacterium]